MKFERARRRFGLPFILVVTLAATVASPVNAGEKRGDEALRRTVLGAIEGMKGAEYQAERSAMAKVVSLAPAVVPVLTDLLDYLEGKHRKHLCEALWQIGDRRAIPALWKIVKDKKTRHRDWAAQALCRMGEKELVDKLIGLLEDSDRGVRMVVALDLMDLDYAWDRLPFNELLRKGDGFLNFCILTNLMDAKDPNYIPMWIQYCKARDINMSHHAADALGDMAWRGAEDAIRGLLDEDLPMSLQLCGALNLVRLVNDRKAFDFLLEAAQKGDTDTVEEAVKCLGRIGDKEAIPVLLKILEKRGWKESPEAAKALGLIGDSYALAALQDAWKGDKLPRLQIWAAFAVAKISKDPKALRFLADAAKDVERNQQALEALLDIAGTEEIPAVFEAMKDNNSCTREVAVKVLENIGDKKCVVPLIACLKDDCWAVRVTAARALRRITGQSFGENPGDWKGWFDEGGPRRGSEKEVEEESSGVSSLSPEARALVLKLKSEKFWERNKAIKALGMLADPATAEILIQHLQKEPAAANRSQCVWALGEIGDKRAVPYLIRSLEHGVPYEVDSAATALAKINDKDSLDGILDVVYRSNKNHVKIWGFYTQYCLSLNFEYYDELVEFVYTDVSLEQKSVSEALGWIGDDRAVKILAETMLKDERYAKRKVNLIHVLGWTDNMKAVPYLLSYLKDEIPRVRYQTNVALKRITGKDFGESYEKWKAWFEATRKGE